METQTKHRRLPEEFWETLRWLEESVAQSERELEEMRELSRRSRKDLEDLVGPIPETW